MSLMSLFFLGQRLATDGSGYYVMSVDEVGGDRENLFQSHNFFLRFGVGASCSC